MWVRRREKSIVFHQDLLRPLEVGEESEGRTQQMSSTKTGREFGGEEGERKSEASLPALLPYLFLRQA